MTCCAGPMVNDAVERLESSAQAAILAELNANGRELADGSVNFQIAVPQMHCGACISSIERRLGMLPGVTGVRANLSLRQVAVTLSSRQEDLDPVLAQLEALGYQPHSPGELADQSRDDTLRGLIRALAVAGFAAANVMLLSVPVWTGAVGPTEELFHYVSALIAIPAVAYAGQPFFASAFGALRHRRVNMDVPISLGVLLATAMSFYETLHGGGHAYFDAAVSLLFFLLIGRVLDQMMRNRARAAAGRLAQLAAKGGMAVSANGELTYLPLGSILPGMIVRVAAGERFPVDGNVVDGSSDVDRALITGESMPEVVSAGSAVEAGTLNLTGSVDVVVTRAAEHSFLAEISKMMMAAESGRGSYVRLSDRMARAYAPVVHVLAAATFVGWLVFTRGDVHSSLTAAVAVLIITCPCALGLAVPVAQVVTAGKLFAAGILMKDGSALERLSEIDTVAFDKTGTLTSGKPEIGHLAIPAGEYCGVAKAMALRSVHPAAKALAAALVTTKATNVADLREFPGQGVEASSNGHRYRLGRLSWVAEIVTSVPARQIETGLAFAKEGGEIHFSTLVEKIRDGASSVAEQFRKQGIDCLILSGDSSPQVQVIANACGISVHYAGLDPGEKLALLQQMATRGRRVLMVGDGLNDAPALAAAHASMAPASASDVGRMAADLVFTRENLSAVVFAHRMAKKTARIVKENFALAIAYNILAVPLAMAGQLNPLIAAVAMSSSSIIVVANSLRLQLQRPDGEQTSQGRRPERFGRMAVT